MLTRRCLLEKSGFRALYLSGAGVANASYGLPDLGTDFTSQCPGRCAPNHRREPASVAGGCGYRLGQRAGHSTHGPGNDSGRRGGHSFGRPGGDKRCGHRPGKELVSSVEMCDRIKAAVDAKADPLFVIMARTDAAANEGLEAAIERASAYARAGADMIFAEALGTLQEYTAFCRAVRVPVLANITEFGKTPLFTVDELASAGVSMALYPLSAFRAMSAAALEVFAAIRRDGTQKGVVGKMQTPRGLVRIS